jgi:hypothetical protein
MTLPKRTSLLSAIIAALTVASTVLLADTSRAAPAPFDWTTAAMRLPWTAARLAPHGPICPGGHVRFRPVGDDVHGIVIRARTTLGIRAVSRADVNRDGRIDTVIALTCGPNGPEPGSFTSPAMEWFYVYTTRRNRPIQLGYITSSQSEANPQWFVTDTMARRGAIAVTTRVIPPKSPYLTVGRTFRWSPRAHRYLPDRRLPYYPQADRRP